MDKLTEVPFDKQVGVVIHFTIDPPVARELPTELPLPVAGSRPEPNPRLTRLRHMPFGALPRDKDGDHPFSYRLTAKMALDDSMPGACWQESLYLGEREIEQAREAGWRAFHNGSAHGWLDERGEHHPFKGSQTLFHNAFLMMANRLANRLVESPQVPWWFNECVDELRYRRMMEEGVVKEMFREKGFKQPFTDEEFETVLWPRHRERALADARTAMQAAIDKLGIHDIHRGVFKKMIEGHDRAEFYAGIPEPRPAWQPTSQGQPVVHLLPPSSLESSTVEAEWDWSLA